MREAACRDIRSCATLLGTELHLPEDLLGLVLYMQEHLFCSIGEAVYAIIPAFMLGRADREYILTERGRALIYGETNVLPGSETSDSDSACEADALSHADAYGVPSGIPFGASDSTSDNRVSLTPTERRALSLLAATGTRSGTVRVSSVPEQSLAPGLLQVSRSGAAPPPLLLSRG